MDSKSPLNIKSLKEQVYEFLREQLRKGDLRPGSVIDMEKTSKRLGVSSVRSKLATASPQFFEVMGSASPGKALAKAAP